MFDKKKYARDYRLRNLEYFANKQKEWRENNREHHRENQNSWSKEYRRISRDKIICLLGNKCVRCGFSDPRALQIDHVNGGGWAEKKRFGNTDHMVCYYLKHVDEINHKLQLLCANCNWIKKVENNEVVKHRRNIL